ncbi:MAG TPA: hypothetical protein VK607_10625 [Kofleriaceae bacterium]|nr:hypothetical protein [Kofleriaceae bacterium]
MKTDPKVIAAAERGADEAMRQDRLRIAKRERVKQISRARFIAELASRIAAGYTSNEHTSGDTPRNLAIHAVAVARSIWSETGLEDLCNTPLADDVPL